MFATRFASVVALNLALAGGFASAPAYADIPKQPESIKDIDTNKNGRVEKDEYLAFMSRMFDKSAGAKGYCTFQEVERGYKTFLESYLRDPSR